MSDRFDMSSILDIPDHHPGSAGRPGKTDVTQEHGPRDHLPLDTLLPVIIARLQDDLALLERCLSEVMETPHRMSGSYPAVYRFLEGLRLEDGTPGISKREEEVLMQLVSGKTNREISEVVGVSEKTVKNHLWKIYRKIGVENRTQLFNMLITA